MTKTVIISLVAVVAVVAIIVYLYLHKHHVEYALADVEKAVRKAYPPGTTSVSKAELTRVVKAHFHCSTKEAHYIIGVARHAKLVDIKQGHIDLL